MSANASTGATCSCHGNEHQTCDPCDQFCKDDFGEPFFSDNSSDVPPEEDCCDMFSDDDSDRIFPNKDCGRMFPNNECGGMFPNKDCAGTFPNEDCSQMCYGQDCEGMCADTSICGGYDQTQDDNPLDAYGSIREVGANINYSGPGRWTPLHKACEMAYADVVWLLLKHGANANARNCNGFTPLHIAAFNDTCGLCVSLLVCAGADLDCRNEPGQTPLHVAAQTGNEAVVRALVAAGAKRFVKNNGGRTPFDVAEERNIRRLLVCRSLHPISLY